MQTPPDIHITDTSAMTFSEITEGFNRIFDGYFEPMTQTVASFGGYARRAGLDFAQSVVLRHTDGRLVGIAFLGIRGDRAWCGGFGVTPEFRGQGLGRVLAAALVEKGRTIKLRTLQLEVLAQNVKAQRSYLGAGFEKVREIVSLNAPIAEVRAALPEDLAQAYEVKDISAGEALALETRWTPAPERPVWMREAANFYLANCQGTVLSAPGSGEPLAFIVYAYNPERGALPVHRFLFREEAFGRALLASLLHRPLPPQPANAEPPDIYLGDEPEGSDLCNLLRSVGLTEIHRQHEMLVQYRTG